MDLIRSYLNDLVVFPTFFNLSLDLAIRNSWSEPQSDWEPRWIDVSKLVQLGVVEWLLYRVTCVDHKHYTVASSPSWEAVGKWKGVRIKRKPSWKRPMQPALFFTPPPCCLQKHWYGRGGHHGLGGGLFEWLLTPLLRATWPHCGILRIIRSL